jgi:hypothetical protein
MMMIGRSSAEERLAWFLTMLAARSGGPDVRALDLAMQRQDIAAYLGQTIETVRLSRCSVIASAEPHKRRALILTPDLLARLAAADRDSAAIPRERSSQELKVAHPGGRRLYSRASKLHLLARV